MRISPLKTKIVILFLIIIVVLSSNFYQKEVKNFFYLISSPIQKTFWETADNIYDFFAAISQTENLKKEKEELRFKNQELLGELNSLRELKKENENLREALDLGLEKEFELELARVIGKDISQDSLLIDKGTDAGIVKDLPVITSQKVLIGQVSEVYKNFSKVKLISLKENSFPVEVYKPAASLPVIAPQLNEKDIQGITKGKGNLTLGLELVPLEADIEEGDIVFTTTLAGIFPSGLLIGQVGEIKKSDVQPYQTAKIFPAFNFDNLEQIFIIMNF